MDEIWSQPALTFAQGELAQLFPAFLHLDLDGRVLEAGPSLLNHGGADLIGSAFFSRFQIEHPANVTTMEALRDGKGAMIVRMGEKQAMRMRGVALRRHDGLWLILGHIPDLDSAEGGSILRFSDLSPIDGTLDMLLAAEMRSGLLMEARDLAGALQEQTKAAERANSAKSAFLAAMSHEIRTPMNGVLGLAALLAGTELTARQREMLDVMIASGRLLMDILNDVLDLSKIESGAIDLETTPFNAAELVRGVEGLFAPSATAKGLALAVSIDAPQPWLLGDPVRIRQILCNLVSNAIKFTDAGHIRIEAEVRRGSAGAAVLEITVCDSGIGMSAEAISRLFQPFVQADGSTTRRFGGTGLGLAIAKLLCTEMKGDVLVKSRLGRGSIFTVVLPLAEAAAPAPAPAPKRGEGHAGMNPPHVLIVEDNATNRFVLSLFLQKLGATFDMAQHGAEALIAWEGSSYDIILMDVEMPVLDGLEATRELRRREKAHGRRYTPIIGLSADAMLEKRDMARLVGMDEFATKPIELERLQELIESQVARHGAASQPALSSASASAAVPAPLAPRPHLAAPVRRSQSRAGR